MVSLRGVLDELQGRLLVLCDVLYVVHNVVCRDSVFLESLADLDDYRGGTHIADESVFCREVSYKLGAAFLFVVFGRSCRE